MTVAVVTGAASGMGRACVERVRGLAEVVVAVDLQVPDLRGTTGLACDDVLVDGGMLQGLAAAEPGG